MATVTNEPWDGSASRWPSAVSYCASCLIDTNDGTKIKGSCHLPVREPSGAVNANAVRAAGDALLGARGASFPADQKAAAARKLVLLYRTALKEDPPADLVALAGR